MTAITLATGLNTTNRAWLSNINSQVYLNNDFDKTYVIGGAPLAAIIAGIVAPAAFTPSIQAGGSVTVGTHLVRYRYQNSKTLYVSDPSDAVSVTTTAGNQTVRVPVVASGDAKVDTIIVEMTALNGTVFYQAITGANSSTNLDVTIADATLIQQAILYNDFGNEPPPICRQMVPLKGRAFAAVNTPYVINATFTNGSTSVTGTGFSPNWGGRAIIKDGDASGVTIASSTTTTITLATAYTGTSSTTNSRVYSLTPNRIYWSEPGYPEGFNLAENARDVLQGRGDRLAAIWPLDGRLLCLGRASADLLEFTVDPGVTEGQIVRIPGERGAFNPFVILEHEGAVFCWDSQGMWEVGRGHISSRVDDLLKEIVDYSYTEKFHCCYDPADRLLFWFFVYKGDTEPKWAVVYERDTGRWWLHSWRQAILSSTTAIDANGIKRAIAIDESGYSWFLGAEGYFDGVDNSTYPAANTASGTPTRTVVPVATSLPYQPVGCVVWNVTKNETAICASSTSTVLTMAGTGFTTAPAAGDVLYIGSINTEYKTKWWVANGLETKKRPNYLMVKCLPTSSSGKLKVYFYKDFDDTTPVTFTKPTGYVDNDGVTTVDGQTYASVDLDAGGQGFCCVPMPSDWSRSIMARIVSDRPDGEMKILEFQFMLPDEAEAIMENG